MDTDRGARLGHCRERIRALHRADDGTVMAGLLPAARFDEAARGRIRARAAEWVVLLRGSGARGLDRVLRRFDLSSPRGLALLGLAEALLRIPDAPTAEALLRERLAAAGAGGPGGEGPDRLLASARALLGGEGAGGSGLAGRLGEPLVWRLGRAALLGLGRQFILGRDMADALRRGERLARRGWRLSYDMLGEGARTREDARRHLEAYRAALGLIPSTEGAPGAAAPGISVKLSALHPRFEPAQYRRVMEELAPALAGLAATARQRGVALTLDAEETDRLELTLDLFERLAREPGLSGWDGLGLAVQAYQKRAAAVVDWLAVLSRDTGRRFMVRLVKGAYWDTEVRLAQERGLADYPVFTRKACTDVSWLACARKLLADPAAFYPQFATHNAQSVAAVMEMAGGPGEWEFQRLFGMGEALYEVVRGAGYPCRIYAPVGGHNELLPYLVRRLLENGAGLSFVNRLARPEVPAATLLADPALAVSSLAAEDGLRHPAIPLPAGLFGPERRNSRGLDLTDAAVAGALAEAVADSRRQAFRAAAPGQEDGKARPVTNPADRRDVVGMVVEADSAAIERALVRAAGAWRGWDATPARERAACLERTADLMERGAGHLVALLVREGGRTLADAAGEVREAADFCRYYAVRSRADFDAPRVLPGPAGERNELSLHGRGVFACISPWNFPLAIFTGQVAAALAAGNPVLAKPAEQTPLTAALAVEMFRQARVPADVLQLLPGDGAVGDALAGDPRVAGVAFTGSTATARAIARRLAAREGALTPLIAETGGLNALIADGSALPEQLVRDVMVSAFNSAGQRCSSLRLLLLQEELAEPVLGMLAGAMAELAVGDPGRIATDVGPVIDEPARGALEAHVGRLAGLGRLIHRCVLPEACRHGTFFPPQAWEIPDLSAVPEEVFGPILHVLRWPAGKPEPLLEALAASGYGLTLGIHSRVESFARRVRACLPVGNTYVNRSMIGAVVGSQPFGGEGLSGTGPKAGGPHALLRYATERCVTVDTTAGGGNTGLLALGD